MSTIVSWAQGSSLSGTGSGTEADPYRIYNAYQLAQLNNFQDQSGLYFELMNDLDISEYIRENNPVEGWEPVSFSGILKGKNHTIKGLYINRESSSGVGFFGTMTGATVKDLTIEGTSVKGGLMYVGGFVGQAGSSIISNCKITLSSTTAVSGKNYVGGFAGLLTNTTVTDCKSTGDVKATGTMVGGFVGQATNSCSFTGCVVTSNVNCIEEKTGGFAGESKGVIRNVIVTGTVTGGSYTGGVVGNFSGTIQNATRSGDVTGRNYTGGVIGSAATRLTLTDITVKGNVSASSYMCVGGIAGSASGTGSLSTISYTGDVKGNVNVSGGIGELATVSSVSFDKVHTRGNITNDGDYTGGVVGKSNGGCISSMESCSHFGDIQGKNYIGGVIGSIEGTESEPVVLHEYNRSTSSSTNTKKNTIRETIVSGTNVEAIVNNCTSVGNLTGLNYVGGIIGCNHRTIGYTSKGDIYSYSNDAPYMWRDNSYLGYKVSPTVYTYTRNSVSTNFYNNSYSGVINAGQYVGGIAGYSAACEISRNLSSATISGVSSVGGVVGFVKGHDSSVVANLKSNIVSSPSIKSSETNVGRIYGERGTNVTIGTLGSNTSNRAYVQCAVSQQGVAQVILTNEQNGNSVGEPMLKLKANYVSWGWDFDDNWNILETESFPYKKYQAAPPYLETKLVSQSTTITGKSVNGGIVSMFYRDRDAVTFDCGSGHDFTFTTEPLQSGSQIQLFADVEGMVPSYFNSINVQYPGSGTEDDPYLIYTAEDLHLMPGAGYFKIMNDIDLAPWIAANSPTTGWIPVGGNSSMGTYIDGNGCTISGLWMNTDAAYSGLFANFTSGYIKNLNVKVASGKKVKGGQYTGILIGKMANGQIQNCTVEGDAAGTKYLGGLVGGIVQVELTGNTAEVNLTISASNAYVGGIAGMAQGVQAVNDNVCGSVSSSGASSYVGGLFGRTSEGEVTKSQANVTINVAAAGTESKVGGLIGQSSTPVSLCYTTGSVKALGADSYTAGLVGYADNTISDSYTTAEITGTLYTAGIAGYTTSTINKCYVSGNIHGQRWGAGIVGYLDGSGASLTNSVVVSNILSVNHEMAWACRVIGGFKNGAAEPDASNYALNTMQVSINDVPKTVIDDQVEGIAKTETVLKSSATYSALGWDMTQTWSIGEGTSYPTLKWLSEAHPVTEVILDETSLILIAGKNAQLTATICPASASNKQVTWTSSNAEVATVEEGLVTAVAEGKATITVTSVVNPEITASCEVTVSASLESAVAALRTLISAAQSLYDNSTEGEEAGQYEAGSRAALLAVITTVNGKISDEMTQSAIAECTTQINEAVTAFGAKQVAEPEPAPDYTMSIAPVSSASGTSAILSVCMTNKNAINGFQFDLVLPECVTLQKTARGKYIFNIGERGDDHTFSSILREDGSVRVVCTSLENTVFTGNSGEVCQIPVDLAESLINGTYAVRLKNVSLSDEASTDIQVDDVETNIIVLNDYFEVGTASGSVGKVVTLPVAMKNKSADICGFQCDIVMPEGFSIAVNDKGKYLLSVTERGDDHSFSALDRANNTVRVVCTSLTNSSFTGSEGDLFEISLITSKSVEAGEYEIKLTNVALSNTASLDIPVADVSGTVTLKRYNPGDVNDDGKISVADVTAAISFVLGSESPSFIREAADMDASNEVKVNDVTAIISLVLNNDITPANAPARMLAMQRTSTENASKLYVEPFSIAPGEEKYIDLMLDNPDLECIGWQADVQLPAGLSFVMNDKGKYVTKINDARTDGYSISSNIREENTVRFIGVSMENFSIEGTNGAIMSILVKAERDAAEGIYYGSVTNGALSDVASNDVPVEDSEFVATIAGEETDYAEGYSLVIKPFKADAGTAYTLTMNFNCATEDITDIEFDIVAPAILARTKSGRASKAPAFANEDRICAEDHSIELAADGHVTISAIVSDEYRMIAGTSGSFVDFYYTANAGIAEGIYQFEINNIKMTMDDGTVLDVAPYKADVYVGSSKAVSENGCVAFNGDYADAATYKLLTDAMPAEGITSVDLTGVTALPANTTIALANPNALILTSKDLGLNNDQNVVIGDECAKFVITDGYPFNAPKSFTAADASYSRAMSNKYGTIVLPYAVESSATVQYYVLSDATVSGAEGTLIFTPVSSVAANQPALFQYTDGGEAEMVSMSAEVAATPSELIDILDGTDLQGSWAMLGSFEQQDVASPTVEGMTAYYIKNDTFWQANKSISVKPFRSYFLNGTTMQKTSYRIISDATGIDDITDQLNADDAVSYDLGGRQVETSEKNQVIVTNGSKTIIR